LEKFPPHIHRELAFYIYRLDDPETKQPFYVGKGRGNRAFEHAALAQKRGDKDDILPLKLEKINDIQSKGKQPDVYIVRWGIHDRKVAYQIEASVIDCYKDLANEVAGHKSREFGLISASRLAARLAKKQIKSFPDPVLLLDITRTFDYRKPLRLTAYDAARWAWPIDYKKATGRYVLAHQDGIVIAVFGNVEWMKATIENVPKGANVPDREKIKSWQKKAFTGDELPRAHPVARRYLDKLIPQEYRNSQTGVRYPMY
jgi:hypothetical protein